MESHENIDKMYYKFNDLIKNLEVLEKEYSLGEKNRKFLNTLSKDWESKVTAIEEVRDLNFLPIESLINSLTSYELKFKSKVQEEEDAKVRKNIALKASQDEDDSASLDEEDAEVDDSDLALITRSFKRILNKRRFRIEEPSNSDSNQFNNTRNKGRYEATKKQGDKCFEYGQLGHYISECPMKKRKGERKSRFNNFRFTWNECNSDGEIEEEEESAQLAFMTVGYDEVTTCNFQFDSNDETGDDLESSL